MRKSNKPHVKETDAAVRMEDETSGISSSLYTIHKKKYALITGASRGLGKAFTIELAKRNINVLLVALPNDGLPELCNLLNTDYQVECDFFEADFTRPGDIDDMVKWATGNYSVNILINNAGMGGSREFELAEKDYLDNMISLNIRALTLITHQLLPELRSHKQSYVLNVASMASFSPIGYKTIYPASKVFVLYFSRGLAEELKGSGVSVSVVYPGPMKTNQYVTKRIIKQGIYGRIGLLEPEYVASRSIDLMFRRKSHIILGWLNHFSWLFMKTVPSWIRLPVITRRVKKELSTTK
jgi:uncharacterized protein